jgi:predicted DNA-binding transcriptional regulator YafY
MLQTSARLLRLLTLLQARRAWTGRELCERLEIKDRTLRRDADRLRSLGYPVHSTSGPAGGYSLGAGASLPPLQLGDDEGVAVAVALQLAAGGSVSGIDDAAQRALAKLEQVLPARLRRRIAALRVSIVRLGDAGPSAALSTVATLAAACSDRVSVSFAYRDAAGAHTQRTVEPHRLVHMERRWYLVAWDTRREDFRTFRVDRVVPPLELGKAFVARSAPGDDVAAYVTQSVSGAPYRAQARVIVHATLAELRERLPPSAGTLEPIDAHRCRFHTGARSLEALASWLGMLGFEFEVEHPAALQQELAKVGARLQRAARKPRARRRA